jgi:flagellar biosynthesis/type III secretory pathway protein FliH
MSENSKKWALPEFGLITNVHHNTNKKLKLQNAPIMNPIANLNVQESYQQGHDKGYSDGMKKAMLEMSQHKQLLSELITQVRTVHEQKSQEKELSILRFVKKCVKN